MVQCVRNIEMPRPIDHHCCGKIQQSLISGSAITTEVHSRHCTDCNVSHRPTQVGLLGHSAQVDLASFSKRILIDLLSRRSGWNRCRSCVKRLDTTRNRLDTVGRPIDLSNDVVLRVSNEEVSLCVEGQTLRLIQTGHGGDRSITGPA